MAGVECAAPRIALLGPTIISASIRAPGIAGGLTCIDLSEAAIDGWQRHARRAARHGRESHPKQPAHDPHLSTPSLSSAVVAFIRARSFSHPPSLKIGCT